MKLNYNLRQHTCIKTNKDYKDHKTPMAFLKWFYQRTMGLIEFRVSRDCLLCTNIDLCLWKLDLIRYYSYEPFSVCIYFATRSIYWTTGNRRFAFFQKYCGKLKLVPPYLVALSGGFFYLPRSWNIPNQSHRTLIWV